MCSILIDVTIEQITFVELSLTKSVATFDIFAMWFEC